MNKVQRRVLSALLKILQEQAVRQPGQTSAAVDLALTAIGDAEGEGLVIDLCRRYKFKRPGKSRLAGMRDMLDNNDDLPGEQQGDTTTYGEWGNATDEAVEAFGQQVRALAQDTFGKDVDGDCAVQVIVINRRRESLPMIPIEHAGTPLTLQDALFNLRRANANAYTAADMAYRLTQHIAEHWTTPNRVFGEQAAHWLQDVQRVASDLEKRVPERDRLSPLAPPTEGK